MKKFFTILVFVSFAIVPFYTKVHADVPNSNYSTIYDDPSSDTYNDTTTTAPASNTTTTPPVPTNTPNATNTAPSTQTNSSYNCSSIKSISDYNICCAPNGGGTSAQCDAYEQSNPALTTVPGQISSGGTPTTNPINNGISSNLGGSNTSNANVQDVASTCSAIQFLTIIAIAIWVKCIIGTIIIPGIFTLAFAIFLWGVLKFIRASDKADKDDSKQFIYMGLIGLFVMTSVWGIIKIFTTTLGVDTVVPTLQTDYLTNSSSSSTTPSIVTPTSSGSGTSQ